ncbi:hypothetical protein FDZ74_06205, partial [bacterium]
MTQLSPELVLAAHQVLADFHYERRPVERGYANRTLYVNLDSSEIQSKPVTQKMKELFTGGRGFAMWLLWNAVADGTAWNDPSNELIIAGGPIGGITGYPGSGKCTAVTISPLTHSIIDSNSGRSFRTPLQLAAQHVRTFPDAWTQTQNRPTQSV